AALIADATDGRFILGLGVSHQPINQALGIAMPHPLAELRRYVGAVQAALRGEGVPTHLPQRPAPRPVPLYVAALGAHAVARGGGRGAERPAAGRGVPARAGGTLPGATGGIPRGGGGPADPRRPDRGRRGTGGDRGVPALSACAVLRLHRRSLPCARGAWRH